MIIYSIYKLVNKINGKCYIGFTQNFEKRMREHLNDSKRNNTHLCKAIRKYGWCSFEKEIIYQSCEKYHCKCIMENHFINQYDSYHNGYNMTLGGEGKNGIVTETSKKKMSISRRNRFNAKDKDGNIYVITNQDPRYISGELVGINKGVRPSEDTRKKQSLSRMGNKNRLGIKHTEETKRIISEKTSQALKGKRKTIVSCPHCGKTGDQVSMKGQHFDKCKSKL